MGNLTPTGSLQTARYEHTATLLSNGKVLVVGGNNGVIYSGAEIADPATGSWTMVNAPPFFSYTATLLLDGQVLVTGGVTANGLAAAADAALLIQRPTPGRPRLR